MNGNAELLNFIYQNSQMGVETLQPLMNMVEEEAFKTCLASQLQEYQEINRMARSMLNQHGYDEKGIGALDTLKTHWMINVQTLTNKTSAHIAEMLMIGSNMGVINAVKNLKKYRDAQQSIVELMEKLLRLEENNIQQLKAFLA